MRRVARYRRRQHAVELRHVVVDIGDHRKVRLCPLRFRDVADPAGMAVERIDGEPDDLYPAPVEFRLDLGHVAEFGGADWREILRMREQDGPGIADPVMELDRAFRGFRLEIRCDVVDCKCHDRPHRLKVC
ncbi:hypothetical protein D3C87_1771340 [compost metagenome]